MAITPKNSLKIGGYFICAESYSHFLPNKKGIELVPGEVVTSGFIHLSCFRHLMVVSSLVEAVFGKGFMDPVFPTIRLQNEFPCGINRISKTTRFALSTWTISLWVKLSGLG